MGYDMPVNEAVIAAPKCCEMCGQQLSEPDVRTYDRASEMGELLRYLAAMWFEHRHAPSFILLRIASPTWTYDQIAAQLMVSKAEVGRIAAHIESAYPELAALVHIYAAKPDSQKARRSQEVKDAATHTGPSGHTWRATTWERTKAKLQLRAR